MALALLFSRTSQLTRSLFQALNAPVLTRLQGLTQIGFSTWHPALSHVPALPIFCGWQPLTFQISF